MKTNETLIGTGEVARLLGLPRHRLIALLDAGHLPEPGVRIPGRRLFTKLDIDRMQIALEALETSHR